LNIKPKITHPLSPEQARFIEELIYNNYEAIYSIVFNALGASYSYLWDEAISELFVLLCEKIDVLQNHPAPQGWLFVSARYVAKGITHKHKRDLSQASLDEINYDISKNDIFEEIVYKIWLENNVPEKLISQLSKREKEIYHKIYIEHKKPKEIAKELSISENNVRNIKKNLKDKIHNALKKNKF